MCVCVCVCYLLGFHLYVASGCYLPFPLRIFVAPLIFSLPPPLCISRLCVQASLRPTYLLCDSLLLQIYGVVVPAQSDNITFVSCNFPSAEGKCQVPGQQMADSLPPEIWTHVFSYFETLSELLCAACVCKSWRNVVHDLGSVPRMDYSRVPQKSRRKALQSTGRYSNPLQ